MAPLKAGPAGARLIVIVPPRADVHDGSTVLSVEARIVLLALVLAFAAER